VHSTDWNKVQKAGARTSLRKQPFAGLASQTRE